MDAAVIEREPLWNNRKQDHGPFDIIGDVHGCCDELDNLLQQLGYDDGTSGRHRGRTRQAARRSSSAISWTAARVSSTAQDRHGDVEAGAALCVPGNHDIKLMRKLRRPRCQITHGLDRIRWRSSSASHRSSAPRSQQFIDGLVSHYVFDDGKLVVAHAGMKAGDAGPRVGERAGLRAVRRDDRRDRRVRPSRSLQLGGRVPRDGERRLRAHARARARVAQPARSTSIPAACSAAG